MVGFVELSHLRFALVCESFAFAFSCGLPVGYLGLVVVCGVCGGDCWFC